MVRSVASETTTATGNYSDKSGGRSGGGLFRKFPGIPFFLLNSLLSVGILVAVTLSVWLVTFNGAKDSASSLADGVRLGLIQRTTQQILPFFKQAETETSVIANALRHYPGLTARSRTMPEAACSAITQSLLYFLNSTTERRQFVVMRSAVNAPTGLYYQIEICGAMKYDSSAYWLNYRTLNATDAPSLNTSALQYPPTRVVWAVPLPAMTLQPSSAPPVTKFTDTPFFGGWSLDGASWHAVSEGLTVADFPRLTAEPVWEGDSYFSREGRPTFVVNRFVPLDDGLGYFCVTATSDLLQFSALLARTVAGKQRMFLTLQSPNGKLLGVSHGKTWSHSDRPFAEWAQTNRSYYSPLNSTDNVIRAAAWRLWEKHGKTWDLPDVDLEMELEGEKWMLLSSGIAGNNRRVRLYLLQDRASLLGKLDRSYRRSVAIFAGLLVAGFVIGVAFSVVITFPLKSLQRGIQCVSTMDFHVLRKQLRDDRSAVREVRQLQSAFSSMVITLESFSNYVPLSVVQRIIQRGRLPKLEMEEKVMTIAFVDIVGFTELSAELPPDEVVLLLSETLSSVTANITSNDGIVDKYIGDCVMALWNAPDDVEDHQAKACQAAILCLNNFDMLDKRLRSLGLPTVRYRVGMSSGTARVGNVGCAQRFNYTAIGDTVNVAARLEAGNKYFGSSALVTAAVQQTCADRFAFALLGPFVVVGRPEPVVVYELRGTNEQEGRYCQEWNTAMRLYHNRNFHQAREVFRGVLPGKAQQLFLQRCEEYAKKPPADDWCGIEFQGSK